MATQDPHLLGSLDSDSPIPPSCHLPQRKRLTAQRFRGISAPTLRSDSSSERLGMGRTKQERNQTDNRMYEIMRDRELPYIVHSSCFPDK